MKSHATFAVDSHGTAELLDPLDGFTLRQIADHLERAYGMTPVTSGWVEGVDEACKDRGGCRSAGLSAFRQRVREARRAGC